MSPGFLDFFFIPRPSPTLSGVLTHTIASDCLRSCSQAGQHLPSRFKSVGSWRSEGFSTFRSVIPLPRGKAALGALPTPPLLLTSAASALTLLPALQDQLPVQASLPNSCSVKSFFQVLQIPSKPQSVRPVPLASDGLDGRDSTDWDTVCSCCNVPAAAGLCPVPRSQSCVAPLTIHPASGSRGLV